ncbi:MAG TPA: Tat pathway signal sequence domain protein [Opitutaceae bacterium]|nr:Tat pathway signal sequence domain protein [Opitutaceae bacterium]
MTSSRLVSLACLSLALAALPRLRADATVHWLEGAPPLPSGVSFGVPWPRGAVQRGQAFQLTAAGGGALPVQTWNLAYWPDGSIKWTGVATVAGAKGPFQLAPAAAAPEAAGARLRVKRFETGWEIDTGALQARIPQEGDRLIDALVVGGHEVARDGRLVCILQDGPDGGPADTPARETFVSKLDKVTVEQSGPVRAVVKFEGRHRGLRDNREWLPFVVRMYFYAGESTVRVVHTIVFDGDQDRDFIRGLGIVFGVPMREEVQNRHVMFTGDGQGLWSEAVQPLVGRGGQAVTDPTRRPTAAQAAAFPGYGRRRQGVDVFPDQVAGRRVPNRAQVNEHGQDLLSDWAVWDDYKLLQPNSDGFTIVKRTNPQSTWLHADEGKRSSGLVFAGDVSGGLAVSVRNFWQSYPAALEVSRAASPEAELTAWLWSPDAPAMDLRHYDIKAHGLDAVYEDVQPGFSTATGVARTSELTLFATPGVPSREQAVAMAAQGAAPAVLVCSPEYLHSTGVFGLWSLPDRSTPLKRAVEDDLNDAIALYEKAIDQRHWYGFWYFGNLMHSYDPVRHVWRYDLGGMAWDNTELASDMWLWYSFLRTGRADIYRMAEAETRNTSEVDVYHLGRFAGLGSRHNVVPWGCGAKEARISQAAWKRFYYYLSTDERVGDCMREVANADYKAVEYDPMRLAQPENAREKQYPGRVRGGPDWLAFIGNWMTEWERTGDTRWRDKIYAGMDSLSAMPYGFRSGRNLVYGYDAKTGKLYQVSDELGDYNLTTIQGGAEVVFELNGLIDNPGWQKTWLQYCRLEDAPAEVMAKDRQSGTEGADARYAGSEQGGARLAAYAYYKTRDAAFARHAIDSLFSGFGGIRPGMYATHRVAGPEVLNPVDEANANVGTNGVAQSSLEAIEVLAMCRDQLPADVPPPRAPNFERGRGRRPGGSAGDQRTPGQ